MRIPVAALAAALVVGSVAPLGLVAPAQAAGGAVDDPEGDAVARLDVTRVAVQNGDYRLVARG